jgi:RimJ/RimL family protein N-acetyltransferase
MFRKEIKQNHWMIVLDNIPVGDIRLLKEGCRASVGYVLSKKCWGRGIMSEALAAVIEFAFGIPEVYRIWAVCDVENPASARVMVKSGMRKEGILKGWIIHPQLGMTPRDCYSYSLLREKR